jgi:hypothetical protein
MRQEFQCPRCGVRLAIDPDETPLRIEYDHAEWRRVCVHPEAEGLATCPEMIDRLRAIMRRRGGDGP